MSVVSPPDIVVVSHPYPSRTGPKLLERFLRVLVPHSAKLIAIGGAEPVAASTMEGIEIHLVRAERAHPLLIRYLYAQVRIAWRLILLRRRRSIVFLFSGGDTLFVPALVARILGKRTAVVMTSSSPLMMVRAGFFVKKLARLAQLATLTTSDCIVLYSPSLVRHYSLHSLANRIVFAREHFVDLSTFRCTIPLDERPYLVGLVGRFAEEKGVLLFLQAAELVHRARPDVAFMLVGDGPLKGDLLRQIALSDLGGSIALREWTGDESELCQILNQLKLLVLPSLTEGLPHTMLESFACCTPVLASRVGSIPDFIEDNFNGFMVEPGDLELLSAKIAELICSPSLESAAANALKTVIEKFSFESASSAYATVVQELVSS
jgi:glycosyltransferase involved in cell wall biosynthesis